MEPVLSSEEIQTAISNYLEVNKPEIKAKIDKKIDLAVTAAINGAFSNGYHSNGWARKAVFDAVNGAAKHIIANDITIDAEKIREKVQKQVDTEIRKIKINLGV